MTIVSRIISFSMNHPVYLEIHDKSNIEIFHSMCNTQTSDIFNNFQLKVSAGLETVARQLIFQKC